ncbi:hypothetical protein [Haladaptatus sp. DYF46]|uniref:hypothetical protein n=1 Tax=Haladaptatus sp. DYF46 TaxID=2886041 RepID=UPI001E2B8352|nr:hypothetical protein [Haladaptatus sp. DYF46]
MKSPSRRSLLRRFGVLSAGGVIGGLSGCSALARPETARLAELILLNLDEPPHTVHVRISRDGERVHTADYTLDEGSEFGTHENPAPVIQEEWMSTPGKYTVAARVDDQSDWYEHRFPAKTRQGDCFSVTIRIRQGGWLDMPSNETDSCGE